MGTRLFRQVGFLAHSGHPAQMHGPGRQRNMCVIKGA